MIWLVIVGIFVLYWRTQNYYYLIDDIVRRWGYLYDVPEQSPPPGFYSSKPSKWRHLWLSINHAINVFIVYKLFGIYPAALFAFSPLSVPMAAWITGGYYSVTALFTLTAYFLLIQYPNFIGAGLAMIFYTAALGSTITCLGFPFIFMFFNPIGLCLWFPTLMYLKGRRFTKGYKIRDMGKQDSFTLKKIPVMVKTVAYYIYKVVFPYRLAFFHTFGEDYSKDSDVKKKLEAIDGWFWLSLASVVLFTAIGWILSPLGIVWFMCTIGPFSQFKCLGQFVAERYLYLPLIGWCLILGSALSGHPILFGIFMALYIIRSHLYIPTYEKIESLYEDGIRNIPDCLANYANLGERYIHTGRLLDGKNVLARGIEIDPENFLCYTNIAAYWTQVQNIEKGLYYTEKAMELGKKKSSWFIIHAMGQQKKGLLDFEKNVLWKATRPQPKELGIKKVETSDGSIRWA